MAFGLFRKPVPEPAVPVVETKPAHAVAEPMAEPDSAREILELLDLELGGLIRQLERAAQSVAGGAQSTAATLATIRERTDALSGRSSAARNTATSFAEVCDKFTRSAEGIGRQVRDDLFDTNYVEVAGTNPVQCRTKFLDWTERALPAFQEAFLVKDKRVAFCAVVDRNGYLPVHNKIYSQPQRAGDVAWNTANCRNRRIFNDATGLAAGQNQRSYLIQGYARDIGGGNTVMMREIDVPVRVRGRHWGAFRTAYKL